MYGICVLIINPSMNSLVTAINRLNMFQAFIRPKKSSKVRNPLPVVHLLTWRVSGPFGESLMSYVNGSMA